MPTVVGARSTPAARRRPVRPDRDSWEGRFAWPCGSREHRRGDTAVTDRSVGGAPALIPQGEGSRGVATADRVGALGGVFDVLLSAPGAPPTAGYFFGGRFLRSFAMWMALLTPPTVALAAIRTRLCCVLIAWVFCLVVVMLHLLSRSGRVTLATPRTGLSRVCRSSPSGLATTLGEPDRTEGSWRWRVQFGVWADTWPPPASPGGPPDAEHHHVRPCTEGPLRA